ncbi:hypothetical protein bcgnr5390_65860 [Bacillus luti]|uniref:Uncharacterized protein n=1 Tax=Bacillus cereus TaxID=1396 RepID=A0A164ME32_BACCE|nr:hypothetical protein bcere0028_54380 [Bacillus cereus AH1271]KZD58813.1 hypothetical protein B4088_4246 [Bacillus cereus]
MRKQKTGTMYYLLCVYILWIIDSIVYITGNFISKGVLYLFKIKPLSLLKN